MLFWPYCVSAHQYGWRSQVKNGIVLQSQVLVGARAARWKVQTAILNLAAQAVRVAPVQAMILVAVAAMPEAVLRISGDAGRVLLKEIGLQRTFHLRKKLFKQ